MMAIKGNRTKLLAAGGILSGLGMLVTTIVSGDYTNVEEGITLVFISGAQLFQRMSTDQ